MGLNSDPNSTTMTINSLDALVDDIIIQILQLLSVRALLALRTTARRYYLLSKLRCVWHVRYRAEVLAHNLPAPGPQILLAMLSAAELERRTTRALHLARAWPQRLSARTLVAQHRTRVDQVVFIPGGTELLTVQGDRVVHWLVVGRPGLTQLKHVCEWTPMAGVPCRVVKDADVPGVIVVGPREPQRFHRFAKVASTSLKAPFVTLCDYPCVPGVVEGVWRHLLLLDTTRDGGGVELLDWRAQTTGTALLPRFPDLFGSFLDFVVFSRHLLVVWEHCTSVFPIPHIPADGQVVVEHVRVFMFQEAVSRPVAFTTCVARAHADEQDADGRRKRPAPTLTIAARSRRQAECVSMAMLVPLDGEKRGHTFAYRLTYLPVHPPTRSEPRCTALCLGSSGRGVYVVGQEVRLVSPGVLIIPPYEMQVGPVFEEVGVYRACDLDRLRVRDETEERDRVDFDEGMGRFVVANEHGFDVVQLD